MSGTRGSHIKTGTTATKHHCAAVDDMTRPTRRQRRAILVSLLALATTIQFKAKKKRRWWVRPGLAQREQFGEYHGLYSHLRSNDHELFAQYCRMSTDRFDHLLGLVEERLSRCTHNRQPVPPAERLAITLCFLATGCSQALK